ncbi:hypothetical protein AUK40_00630 [Candidatus Wirthbacteria bacterium CG2_30_54_11]|uniref:DUF998 domain-containing protein n=1 Tax=Candidatus Wirthbacteria bacterium CG2_30_54_11 TaxID=1817892 RepID=A0A1J5IRE6_9BACT|nr:MAG: hypothetical protein AUK40_00630 [Candidatus Wirthbacteria bacterium CG2_30_54_11]
MRRFLIWYCILSPIVFALVIAVLGFVTPGYDPAYRTIGELSIGKYGWIEQANLLQLALCYVILSYILPIHFADLRTKKIWTIASWVCALVIVAVVLFPTLSLEELRVPLSSMPLAGIAHWLPMGLLFAVTPYLITIMAQSTAREKAFKHLAIPIAISGYVCCILMVVWLFLFYFNSGFGAFGLLQRVITLCCLFWPESCALVMRQALRPDFKNPVSRTP